MNAHTGEIAGLFASFTWAIGSLIYSRANAPPAALNLFKNTVASILFIATLGAFWAWRGGSFLSAGPGALGWLFLSAVVGLVIGDTLYFVSLQSLGARRALVLTTLAPTWAALLGWAVLGEGLTWGIAAGMALTLLGVIWVIGEGQEAPQVAAERRPPRAAVGAACGALGALCQAGGAVLSRLGLSEIEPLEASAIRLVMAAGAGMAIAVLFGRLRPWTSRLLAGGQAPRLLFASVIGTYLGIWLSLTAFKWTKVAVATTLTSLSPIFVIPIAWLILGQRASLRAVLGAALAVAGVALLF